MVVFSSFAVLLFLSLVKDTDAATWDNKRTSLETVKWLCEHHTYATSSEFSMTLINNSTEAYFCKLSLPYNTPKEEWPRLCQHMHPSYYVEAKVENEETVCTQEIMYLCPPGQFPMRHLCLEFLDEEKTFDEAELDCETRIRARLPDDGDGQAFWDAVIAYLNPRRLGYKSRLYWSGGKEKKRIAVGRGLDLQAVGTAVKTDNSSRAGYICVYNGMKTQRIYEKECTIYREQFKLPAYFLGGTCYMVSPSVTSSERAEDLHSQCKWLTNDDRVVSPLSTSRLEGIDGARDGSPFEYDYITTTGEKTSASTGDEREGWHVINVDKTKTYMVKNVWASGRPKMNDGDGIPNTLAVSVPKSIREPPNWGGIFRDLPRYFRGHLVCATGTTPQDNAFKECDANWTSITRDDGRVMCTKAFTDGLAGTSYDEAMAFCKTFGAVLAPMESADEQTIITGMAAALNPPKGSMWIGARRQSDGRFYWELDHRPVMTGMGTNWHTTAYHSEPNNSGGHEDCLQLFMLGDASQYGKWNDIGCESSASRNYEYKIHGGVCAKYHQL